MKPILQLLVPVAALGCVSCVQADGDPPEPIAGLSTERSCFFASQVDSFGQAPDGPSGERIYVRTGVNDRYLLETHGACPDIDWNLRLALDAQRQTSLCTGDWATVLVPRTVSGTPQSCTARVLGRTEG